MYIYKSHKKIQNNFFCFWDKYICIGCIKVSLIRREYLSSAVSVLADRLKTLDVTDSDFFQFNYLHID